MELDILRGTGYKPIDSSWTDRTLHDDGVRKARNAGAYAAYTIW
jgi:hypothetical protein